jgi:anti-anti-sigma regulatory factor
LAGHGHGSLAPTRRQLDLSNFEEVMRLFEGWEEFDLVLVDTTEVTFLDSSGFSALPAARRTLGSDRFRLIPGPATLRLLDLTSTADLFGVR